MNKIRAYREKSGLTQQNIAEKLNIRPNAVSQWETHKRSPSVRHLYQLTSILGCSMEDLMKPDVDDGEVDFRG